MAARRLLIIMLVLLGVSTLAAALVDTRSLREDGTGSTIASETETQTIPANPDPVGLLKPLKIEVGGKEIPVVPMKVGQQLPLIVESRKADQLEIAALGLLEPVSPDAPARFDILAQATGSYGMRLVGADRVVARIRVTKAPGKDEAEEDAQEKASTGPEPAS